MEKRMSDQEFIAAFDGALANDYIFAVYQPQINHSTGRMIGAEALMRWKDPEFGMQFPSDFIPVLEDNNLIYRADLHLFEQVCKLQRKCLDEKRPIIPISFNVSRYDIYVEGYVDKIEEIRKKYDVPVKYLRVEITESSAIGGMELVTSVLDKLHSYGYVVEMDDFGSGYSSLNILKDLDVDVIKLDMVFLRGKLGGRGGAIISSIIQMAKWLATPVVAEGVETMEQADYMKSIGCNYIQGYLYSKPVSENEFLNKVEMTSHEPITNSLRLFEDIDAGKFWNPDSFETLIFNNFVGPAAIFTYEKNKVEILRVNEKYIKEIGMLLDEKSILKFNPWNNHDVESRRIYEDAMNRAITSNEEVECETWRTIKSDCCGEEYLCIRSNIRVIGKSDDRYLFYCLIQNVTKEKKRFEEIYENDLKLQAAADQVNIYAWDYDIATKDMHPCFRCMRDLGLPPVVHNYPEPAIELGIFPPEVADMYRAFMKEIDEGVGVKEAIIPLTAGRVPFMVRYTTEFDDNGKPVKAYASATLVTE